MNCRRKEMSSIALGPLTALKHDLIQRYHTSNYLKTQTEYQDSLLETKPIPNREDILKQIEDVIFRVIHQISSDTSPTLTYPSTSTWRDISFEMDRGLQMRRNQRLTTVRFESMQSLKKFGLMLKVLSIMYRLIKTDHFCTKRDIYYQDPGLFGTQHILDGIVDNISCMLHVPRWHLHVLATSKGCIAGDLRFQDADNNYIDCRYTQMTSDLITNAAFILVVEKDATFQKLLETKICTSLHPFIMITGKGFPDMNTRMLLKKLWDNFAIPILALVDADPHGMEIMAVYKFGSRALAFETGHLAVPCMKWLGLLPSDITRLGVPESALFPLGKADLDKANELLSRPYMQHHPLWRAQVEEMLRMGKKAELQALDSISTNFLADVYLPSKIRCAGWL